MKSELSYPMPTECFFFVEPDTSGKDDEGVVHAVCVECRMKDPKKFPGAWFYTGQFGPWTVTCYNCNGVIHQHEENDETGGEETTSPVQVPRW